MNLCPGCEAKGRTIKPVTLQGQVVPPRLDQLGEHDGWRLCTSESCEVVYFRDDEVVVLGETRGVPFHKSEDPQRFVCFCFEHSVADVEADVAENGTSTIQVSIKAECKAGRDDCKRKNPQGRCCLGNVGQVVKRAAPDDADGGGAGCLDEDTIEVAEAGAVHLRYHGGVQLRRVEAYVVDLAVEVSRRPGANVHVAGGARVDCGASAARGNQCTVHVNFDVA